MHTKTITPSKQNFVMLTAMLFVLFSHFQVLAVTVTVSASSTFSSYQNSAYSGPYVIGSSGVRYLGPDEDIVINSGITFTINLSNQTVKSIKMGSVTATSPTLAMGTNILTVTNGFSSNTTAAKKITFSGAGTLITAGFSGTNYSLTPSTGKIQITGGSLPAGVLSYYNLTILAPSSVVSLPNSVSVTNILELNNGILDVAGYNITVKNVAGSSGISGTAPSSNSYVRTSNGGKFVRNAGSGILYPVGSSVYAPVTLGVANNATRTFSVSVIDGIDNINGDPITEHVVLKTWLISSTASTLNPDVLVKLDWRNDSEEGANFDDTKNALFILEPGAADWHLLNTFTNETVNSQQNLAQNKFQINDGYKFAVGDANGFALLNNTVALPVELLSFNANKINEAQVELNWSTAWEINNRGFEIERSTNGVYWTNAGFVEGHGNSTSLLNYTFATPIAGINTSMVYYRLKQVDFNGKFEYSAVRTVRLNNAITQPDNIYPNPATDKVTINLSSAEVGQMAKVSVIDITGKVKMIAEKRVESTNYYFDINIGSLEKGNYIINVSSGSVNYNTRLLKL